MHGTLFGRSAQTQVLSMWEHIWKHWRAAKAPRNSTQGLCGISSKQTRPVTCSRRCNSILKKEKIWNQNLLMTRSVGFAKREDTRNAWKRFQSMLPQKVHMTALLIPNLWIVSALIKTDLISSSARIFPSNWPWMCFCHVSEHSFFLCKLHVTNLADWSWQLFFFSKQFHTKNKNLTF